MIDPNVIGKKLVALRGDKSRQTVAKDLKMHRFSYCIRKRITSAVY